MRKIFNLAAVTTALVFIALQSANAGLLGMPLNLRAAAESIDHDAVPAAPSPFYPRSTNDLLTEVIEC
jgi:hypothetical protein